MVVTCASLFSHNSIAAVNYFDLTLEQLLDTKVESVSKRQEPITAAAAAVHVITNEDIIRSGVTTIPDALRMVPGVHVARLDTNSWAISIRGFNSGLANKLLVLVDGRSIYNPIFGGVLWEAHDLMLENIARIEVVRGPGGTLWGANAVNGVINITTKHSRDSQGTLASILYGDEEQGTFSLRQGGSFGVDGSYRVYAKGTNRDTSLTLAGDDAYDETDGFRTGFRVDWGDKFTLQGDAYQSDTKQRRRVYSLIAPYLSEQDQNIRYEGINLLGRWTDKHDDGSQLSVQSFIDWTKRDEPYNFVDDRIIYDVEAQYNFAPMDMHEITAGLGYRFLADDTTGNANVSFSPERRTNNLYSAFIQDKVTLMPETWFLTLGSKFEHNEFSGNEVQPNVRLQWQANSHQTLWTSVSRAVRTPTPIEEDLTSTIATAENLRFAFVPNDNFKTEELIAYELGYRHQITPGLAADVATFHNDYKRLQTYRIGTPYLVNNGVDPLHIFVPVPFTNDMKGESYGFEAAVDWRVHNDLKISVDYSYLHLSVEALDPAQEGAEDLYPSHQVGVQIFWNLSPNWTLDTSTSYVDELPVLGIDDYMRLDINLGGQITKTLRFNLVGQNLLDSAHREYGDPADINTTEIERSIFAKLTWVI